MTRKEALSWFVERRKMNLDDKCQEAEDWAIKALSAIDKIKNDIENYHNFILCADGQKGIHIDEALKIIDKYIRCD